MALIIDDPETERLAEELARLASENVATAIKRALEGRLRRVVNPFRRAVLEDMAEIRRRWSALPVLDDRTPDEILGYDARGLPR